MTIPSDRLRHRVFADFGEHDGARVLEDLLDIPESLPLGEGQNAERMQACVVLPAEGDYERFRSGIERLRLDWRDSLVGAGLEHAEWSRQLDRLLAP